MGEHTVFWIGFMAFIVIMLALDLGVFHRKTHKVPVKEALIWSGIWIFLALIFCFLVYSDYNHISGDGKTKALEFLTAYVVEYSLSVDNIFIFILIFSYFAVDDRYQHKVLFWGIIGALIMRAIFIFTGVALIHRFFWIMYVFGGFLIITGIRMFFQEVKVDPERNPVVRFFRKFLPITDTLHEDKFFIKKSARWFATPLFIVLIITESSDLIFAVDSIPAVLAISQDSFIVFTSNIFAILGLRSLYFAIAGIMQYFRFLRYGLAVILTFVGIKMIFLKELPVKYSLLIIVTILLISVIASVVIKKK
jgi:tellurite resistance protein TerC